MDGSMFNHLPLTGLFWFAVFGAVCAAALTIGASGYAVWWAFHHVAIR